LVAGQQRSFERLGQGHINSVVYRQVVAQNLRHLDIDEMRRMQRLLRVEDALFHRCRCGRAEEDLEHSRGIEDDQRLSRSARTASAGDKDDATVDRL